MNTAKNLAAAIAAGLLVAGNVHAQSADEPRNLQPFFGNFHSAEGYEVAIPFFKSTDSDSDGYPESITISYRVFTAGTNTLIYTTPSKKLLTPAIPTGCAANDPNKFFHFDWDTHFRRGQARLNISGTPVPEGKRMHVAVNMALDCWDGATNQFVTKGAVYSGNLSGVAETNNPFESWMRIFAGRQIAGLNGVDTNDDLVPDTLMITTAQDLTNFPDSALGAVNATVVFVFTADGTDRVPSATYAFTR